MAKGIIKRASLAARTFGDAAKAMTVTEISGWLREFFESDTGPPNPLDPSNPHPDLVLGTSDGMVFDGGYEITGPSLDLG